MKYYKDLLMMGVFTLRDVTALVGGNPSTAKSILGKYSHAGYVVSIKKNLYAAVDLRTGGPSVSVWRVASAITPTSYVSYTSSMSYHGLSNQVSNEIHVSSETQFKTFDFDGTTYHFVASRYLDGVVTEYGVRVTDRERTLVDCIDSFDRIGGLEELMSSIEMMSYLSEEKMIKYLELYGKAVLWQKTGFILERYKGALKLSDAFIEACRSRKANSRRYLTELVPKAQQSFVKAWGLMAPRDMMGAI